MSATLFDRIKRMMPISRKRHNMELCRVKDELGQKHSKELDECERRLDALIDKFGKFQWARSNMSGRYVLCVEFNPEMLGFGHPTREELSIVARCFARKVEGEILTTRFAEVKP